MSFLEPLLLWSLPLAGLPIVIHLINQRRFQTLDWGAMRFLLEANRMSRGFARIRQWLILAARTLAIAGLVVAVSRPLSSGRLGLAVGGRADTTLVLVDRSPSMQQRGAASADSKLARGVEQIAAALDMVGSSRWVLIDSVTLAPQELESPSALRASTHVGPASASADLPALLQAAHDYIQTNRAGQTEIWICSDLRAHDWNADGGQWQVLRESFQRFEQGLRFHLVAYQEPAPANLSLRVTDVRQSAAPVGGGGGRGQATKGGGKLSISLAVSRASDAQRDVVPVQFEINGARSEVALEINGRQATLENHLLPIDGESREGWGRVTIPADANEADNEFYFVFADPPKRRTVIVAEHPPWVRPLQLAASLAPDPAMENPAEVLTVDQLATLAWEEVSLVLWQARLPTGEAGSALQQFVASGGQVLFFPPDQPDGAALFGVGWQEWREPQTPATVDSWRSDHDLLARTRSGAALPVGELAIHRFCTMQGEATPLATLRGGSLLWGRAALPQAGAYFCATTVSVGDSSLAHDGVVLYAAVQRALAAGAVRLQRAQLRDAGDPTLDLASSTRLASAPQALSSEAVSQAGVYASGERLTAVNRSAAEDRAAVLDDKRIDALFAGLDYDRVDDRVDAASALTREIWRLFLGLMIVALIAEAALCVPRPRAYIGGSA